MALILARLLLSLATVTIPATVAASQPEVRQRVVYLTPGAKVPSVSFGYDEVIEVAFIRGQPLFVVPEGIDTGEQAIAYAAARSDVIVLVDIERLTGRLIEEDTWIATDATAAILDLVSGRHRAAGLKQGDRFTFTERGGEIVDRRTTIRTKPDVNTLLRAGGRYLLFLSRRGDNDASYEVITRLEVAADGTVRDTVVWREAQAWQTRMTGLKLERALAAARSAPLRVRILPHRADVPLPSRITPDDHWILLQRASAAERIDEQVAPDVTSDVALATLTRLSAAVAVIDVKASTPRLVEGDTWLATTTTARIVKVIKAGSASRSLTPGRITLEDDGGEMRIQNATVHTSTDDDYLYREAYVPGRRYLVFMTFHQHDAPASLHAYEIRDGSLRDLLVARKGFDYRQRLDGLSLTETTKAIRRLLPRLPGDPIGGR
jgi:hypothetical protein